MMFFLGIKQIEIDTGFFISIEIYDQLSRQAKIIPPENRILTGKTWPKTMALSSMIS